MRVLVVTLDIALGCADVTAHQQLGQFAVTVGDGIENSVVLGKRLMRPIRRSGKLQAVHAHQLIQLAAEHLGQRAVAAALNDPVVKVEVTFLLVVTDAGLERRIALMQIEHPAQFVDFRLGHALCRQATSHALQRLTNLVQLDQLGMVKRHHPCTDVWHSHQQTLAFQTMNRLA
ncbi:hypothetical protein FQZ97_1030520 [compost metagenome]